jgi:hypothetical protein
MEFINFFYEVLQIFVNIFTFAGIIFAIFKFLMPVKFVFSCGSFWIFRFEANSSNITNLVSLKFFSGNRVPPEIREEIILQTAPKVWFVKKIDTTTTKDENT